MLRDEKPKIPLGRQGCLHIIRGVGLDAFKMAQDMGERRAYFSNEICVLPGLANIGGLVGV